jgi:hypothetical protein
MRGRVGASEVCRVGYSASSPRRMPQGHRLRHATAPAWVSECV